MVDGFSEYSFGPESGDGAGGDEVISDAETAALDGQQPEGDYGIGDDERDDGALLTGPPVPAESHEVNAADADRSEAKMPQHEVNDLFAGIVSADEAINRSDERSITSPSGVTETTFVSDDGLEVTRYNSTDMTDEQRDKALAESDERLREAYGRTREEHDALRADMDAAKERLEAARAADEVARALEPGSDNQLAALKELEAAKDAAVTAANRFCFNDFEEPLRFTSVDDAPDPDGDQPEAVDDKQTDKDENSQATDERIREAFGRTQEEHDTLRTDMLAAKERYESAKAADALVRSEAPGADRQLEALKELEAAKGAMATAVNRFYLNDFEEPLAFTPVSNEALPLDELNAERGEAEAAERPSFRETTDEHGISTLTGTPDTVEAILAQFSTEELAQAETAGAEAYKRDSDPAKTRIETSARDYSRGSLTRELGELVVSKLIVSAPEGTAKTLVVNGERINLDPTATHALGEMMKATDSLVADGYSIDCARFAVGFCNLYEGKPHTVAPFHERTTDEVSQNFDLSSSMPITPDVASRLPAMQPIYLDRGFGARGESDPMHHVIVKLPTANNLNLFVEKIGIGGPISVGRLEDLAQFYGSTHASTISRFSLESRGKESSFSQVHYQYDI